MIFFLLLVMLFGETNLGAKRWIDLGFTQFQPSELAKIFLIIFMATYIYKHQETLNTFKTLATVVVFSIIPIGFIYKQPDLSTTIVIFITFCAIMFLSGVHYKIITGVLVTTIPIALVVGYIVLQPSSGILADYQYQRIESFLNKDSDSQSSKDDKWQQENSILAIGSGGLTGKGFNDNGNVLSVKEGNFLPESHTDFIFAIVGEELGFVGAAAVILLLFAIVVECFITGSRAPTLHGRLFCFGFGVLLGVQSFVNIAVTTMILPNTGLPLPFVSYGLTSLVSMYCGIGIVLNIGLQRNKALV
ncbi:cell cycle protein, FtsW/RodA/SpoVE family [Eubacterium ventriosum ATCC 27560]|uniref:Cell cycle protein, FtsW/RodA/SpoVE family n=3 Tax=Eubacterium ventriosum TaxID=39496 RepID=A5Z695_9FIRM|nr:cell cycle protein, FtsW/RodA/SpoVE family [Eubacterium ventriosum ATCC 27560]